MARDEAYREAEKKIEEARHTGAAELDLSNDYVAEGLDRLTELPEALGQLIRLRSLNLANNRLATLPEFLGELTKLQTLNLAGNPLATLPESLARLTGLRTLDLRSNQLTTWPQTLSRLTQLQELYLRDNRLALLPEELGQLVRLEILDLAANELKTLPKAMIGLTRLQDLDVSQNRFTSLPQFVGTFRRLRRLNLFSNEFTALPEWLGELTALEDLGTGNNEITDLPASLAGCRNLRSLDLGDAAGGSPLRILSPVIQSFRKLERLVAQSCQIEDLPGWLLQLEDLNYVYLHDNPLVPELAAAYEQGFGAVREYLRAKGEASVVLNEAKLILIGEGEVGKSCLLDGLGDEPWQEHKSTHGIEIKPVVVTHRAEDGPATDITLNTWDFGGQKVYRPTHQLFFSAPAVYLVVWKPREGPQQGAVEYWINTIKQRAGADAKVLVVATHGGPQQRQPDIDLQDLRDRFGANCVLGAFHVDSRPADYDEAIDSWTGPRKGIAELREVIAAVAASLPNVGREVAASWSKVLESIRKRSEKDPYISYKRFQALCRPKKVSHKLAKAYAGMLNELGYVIHYGDDDDLKEIMILKPDWLAKAISFVLDDEETRKRHGLVSHKHLSQLWSHPPYEDEQGYPEELHCLFRRLMEHFDLSYQVVLDPASRRPAATSLIAQLVDDKPLALPHWDEEPEEGDEEKRQICQIVEKEKNQSANAEGLFYRLIARLHKYSLGRDDFSKSVHWQRGLMLDDRYNGRAVLKHVGNDVHITVRAAYPDFLLYELTKEVKWLVEHPDEGWAGLRCSIMVPCIEPCGHNQPGRGLFEVGKLKDSKRQGYGEYPCNEPGCDKWQNIDRLLQNATTTRKVEHSEAYLETLGRMLTSVVQTELAAKDVKDEHRFRDLKSELRRAMSQVDEQFERLMTALTDEAKEGPRLFSFEPVDRSRFNPKRFTSEKFRLILWCEHARLPLTHPFLNDGDKTRGVYEVELTRDWVEKAAPVLKVLSGTLSLALPIAAAGTKLTMAAADYKAIENQLGFGKACAESFLKGGEKVGDWLTSDEETGIESGQGVRAQGAMLRELHALLKAKDASGKFGGLTRVQNKRREFLWVHPRYESEY